MPARFQARHLFLVPSLVSLMRVPLAALFVTFVDQPFWALAVLLLAGATDMVDGWYARRFDQVTATGAVVDGVTDKFFVAVVMVSLLMAGVMPLGAAVVLSTRELLELPLVVLWFLQPRQRLARVENPMANWLGKGVTVLQFCAIAAFLFASSWALPLACTAGAFGVLAAAVYWRRHLRGLS